ncbi:RICIN domain-containing protein [Nonomuraea sediminis]|uniref:RICIN domain-containing protein n=1 Tax=Nonomuraea sediminis TaxID=2835864 RepID=UPI001BDDA36D|nr:RICIN domain-containing protein [Nonomuraea sediminis]
MKGTRLAVATASLLTCALSAPSAAAASTSSSGPVYWYQIIAQHSGKCLDVAYASLKHAANVIQGACGAGYNQQWRIVNSEASGNYVRLIARHSGKCLDVAYARLEHGANVVQATCGGPAAYNQQWRIAYKPGGGGSAWIIARHSGKCLDVANAHLEHGANVIQGICGGPGSGPNQLWRFKRVAVTWE